MYDYFFYGIKGQNKMEVLLTLPSLGGIRDKGRIG